MEELVAEDKWNTVKTVVFNRFGTPIIETFVPDQDAENLRNYSQVNYIGFKFIFSKLRTWNPAYEHQPTSQEIHVVLFFSLEHPTCSPGAGYL